MLVRDEEVAGWVDLQNRVKAFFQEMDYHAESPKVVQLAGRGKKEVDVYVEDRNASVTTVFLIECKWWETSVPQDTVHAFHTVVHGAGANTGFIISKVGFQAGAKEAAAFTNINLLTFEELQHAFGEEWFRRQQSKIRQLEKELRQRHHLHFDQWNNLPIHNNMIFHTPELAHRLAIAAKHCVNLVIQCGSRFPESYKGPEPVEMACDPADPFKQLPAGEIWHEAKTVRDYFLLLRTAMQEWITDFDSLCDEARRSFDELDENAQDALMQGAMQEQLEEMPVRVLRQHLDEGEYRRLLGLLATRIADAAGSKPQHEE